MPGMFDTLSLQQHSTIKIVFEKPGKAGFDRKMKREVLWYFNWNQETWVNTDLLWPTKMVWGKLSSVVDYMATALTFGSYNVVAAVWFLLPLSIRDCGNIVLVVVLSDPFYILRWWVLISLSMGNDLIVEKSGKLIFFAKRLFGCHHFL